MSLWRIGQPLNVDASLDLQEFYGDPIAPQSDSLGIREQSRTIRYAIPFDKWDHAKVRILGADWVDDLNAGQDPPVAPNWKLKRITPLKHPSEPFQYAQNISNIQYVRYDGSTVLPDPADDTKRQIENKYEWVYADVVFAPEPVPFWVGASRIYHEPGDADRVYLQNESKRYTTKIEQKTDFQLLEYKTGDWRFFGPAGVQDKTFTGQIVVKENREKIIVKWSRVPRDWYTDESSSACIPVKMQAAKNCVNKNPFAGYERGTLLLEDFFVEPWSPAYYVRGGGVRHHLADIMFHFVFFDPKTSDEGVPPPIGGGPSTPPLRGHNLKPRFIKGVGGDPGSIQYYGVSRDGVRGGPKIHSEFDFEDLFKHHSQQPDPQA